MQSLQSSNASRGQYVQKLGEAAWAEPETVLHFTWHRQAVATGNSGPVFLDSQKRSQNMSFSVRYEKEYGEKSFFLIYLIEV